MERTECKTKRTESVDRTHKTLHSSFVFTRGSAGQHNPKKHTLKMSLGCRWSNHNNRGRGRGQRRKRGKKGKKRDIKQRKRGGGGHVRVRARRQQGSTMEYRCKAIKGGGGGGEDGNPLL